MKINVYFVDGSKDGRLGSAEFPTFRRGMEIDTEGETYVIQDGPIAELIEKTQKAPETLSVRAKLKV